MSSCMLSFVDNALPYPLDLGFVFITLISQNSFIGLNSELWRVIGIFFPFWGEMSSQTKFIGWQIWKLRGLLLYICLR